jgi:hypothetical protein
MADERKTLEMIDTASPSENALVTRTIGSAMFDKLLGKNSSLTQVYKANKGSSPESEKLFHSFDAAWAKLNGSIPAEAIAGGKNFAQVYQEWKLGGAEQALVENAIGTAMLELLRGGSGDLLSAYDKLGGKSDTSRKVFSTVQPVFSRINAGTVLAAANV